MSTWIERSAQKPDQHALAIDPDRSIFIITLWCNNIEFGLILKLTLGIKGTIYLYC